MLFKILSLFIFSFAISCSSKLEPKSAPIENGVPASINDHYSGENQVTVSVDREALEVFWGQLFNDPEDIQLVLDIDQIDDLNQFTGRLKIGFRDSGMLFEALFDTGESKKNTTYNSWFKNGDDRFFHMVLTDLPCVNENTSPWDTQSENCIGGIVVVIDEVIDLGDGDGPLNQVGGSLWYKNFAPTKAAHPPRPCWLISLGPYDCRPWAGYDHTQTVEPKAGYKKFVDFFGFRISELFGEDFSFSELLSDNLDEKLVQTRSLASLNTDKPDCTWCYLYFALGFIALISIILLAFKFVYKRSSK